MSSGYSSLTALQEYDLFALPPVQNTVEATIQTEHRPIASINSGGAIEFVITSGVNEYILLRETTLYVKFRVILSKIDRTNVSLDDWKSVSVVNNVLHSMWSQIDLKIGDTQTTVSLQTYPYRSYLECLLGFTEEAKKTYLSAAGWFPGEDEKLEDIIEKRSNCIRHTTPADKELHLGKIFDLEGKLHLDLAFQGRAILGGTKLTFKLSRAPAEFFLMSKNANIVPKIDFLELTLNITRTRINREVVIAHEKALNISPTKYPLTRTDVKTSTINSLYQIYRQTISLV